MITSRAPGGFLPARPQTDCGFLGYKCDGWLRDAGKWIWNESKGLFEGDSTQPAGSGSTMPGEAETAILGTDWGDWRYVEVFGGKFYWYNARSGEVLPEGQMPIGASGGGTGSIPTGPGIGAPDLNGGKNVAEKAWDWAKDVLGDGLKEEARDLLGRAEDATGMKVVPKRTYDLGKIMVIVAVVLVAWTLAKRFAR